MALIETADSPEDVDRLLSDAKRKLQHFEDGVDNGRLLERLRTASAAHPLLILRNATLFLAVLLVIAAIAVPIASLNATVARILAPFDGAVPLPSYFADNLGLPLLLLASALLMAFAWFMATQAALSMGRDAQMLAWEAREHQKLMNDVTRLTTQKAVMERTRNTPGGARPRIATPVPVSMRERGRMAGGLGGSPGAYPGGLSIPPSDLMGAARSPVADLGDYRAPQNRTAGGLRTSEVPAPPRSGGLGLPHPSARTPPGAAPHVGPRAPPALEALPPGAHRSLGGPPMRPSYPPPIPTGPFRGQSSTETSFPPAGGLMARARPAAGTPRPAPNRPSFPPMNPSAPPGPSPFAGLGRSNPPGVDPLKPRIGDSGGPRPSPSRQPAAVDDLRDAIDFKDPDATHHDERTLSTRLRTKPASTHSNDDGWLRDVVQRSRAFASLLPPQIRLEYNQEEGVPFTLVMSRATPAMAIRAMMQFADFLSGILTPPATRVELSSVGNLDRTFASNVVTALDRHFADAYLIESEPGRINILFNEPHAAWEGVAEIPVPSEE